LFCQAFFTTLTNYIIIVVTHNSYIHSTIIPHIHSTIIPQYKYIRQVF